MTADQDRRASGPDRRRRAVESRVACARTWIRASTESFLFSEICRALTGAGYRAAAIHELGRDGLTFSSAASDGARVAPSITLSDDPADGLPVTGIILEDATEPGSGDPPATAAVRYLIRPAGGRRLLLSAYAVTPPGFAADEVDELRELARDLTFALEALAQRNRREADPSRAILAGGLTAGSRSAAEATLREQLEMTRSITDSAQDAIVLIDDSGRIGYWNRAAEVIFGWSTGEALGADLHELLSPERYREASRRGLETFFATGEGAAIGTVTALTAVRKDGTEFPAELSLSRVRLRGRWRAIGIVRDTTERENVLEDLRRAKIAAEAAAEAKSLFLANMSHEIRTPLNAIIGMTGLLLDTELDRQQAEFAGIVQGSGEILLAVINDILDFSKLDAAALELEVIPFSVRTCVEEVGDMLAQKATEKDIELVILVDHQVPSRVAGDPGRLRQVLTNLLNNAIKFTSEGEVVLQVKQGRSRPGREQLVFTVEDTGIGMPQDRLDEIFRPFTQVDASTTRQYGGTGLGLSIAKSLIEAMGGSIEVTSRLGEGTRFRFFIELEPAPGGGEESRGALGAIDGLHVLVVDDNRTNRRLLEELLGRWGCTSVAVGGGAEALDLLLESGAVPAAFDLAILDYSMPGMDGGTLAKALRAEPRTRELPLILLTSMPTAGDGERMRQYGFNAYLTKPVKPAHLHEAIRSVASSDTGAPAVADRTMVTRHTLGEARRARVRILVVEDNIVNQKVASRMLESLGYRCDVADNGRAAVDALRSGARYDVVLMDCQMPVMDGFEATRQIRELEGADRHTAIIATTAGALQGDRELCLAAGMDSYISKPIDRDQLASVLDQYGIFSGDDEPPSAGHAIGTGHELAAPVAIDRLRAISRGDRSFEERILNLYLTECDKRRSRIAQALETGDLETVRGDSHALKGSAANIGIDGFADIASRLQNAAESGDEAACRALSAALEQEHLAARRWLLSYLDDLRTSEPHDD